jgi:hypothetical protein
MTQHMNSKIVGQLNPIDYDPSFFYSQPFPIPYFDNKKLKVGFVAAEHQPYLDGADKSLENFVRLSSIDRTENSDIVHHYYSEALKYGYTKPLDIKTTNDIWNFVTPTEIIIHLDETGDFYLCVSCECEWEEEHGLQLVFAKGQTLTRASGHDGHFTD